MSRYLTDPMYATAFFAGSHVGIDGPAEQCSVHCASQCMQGKQSRGEPEGRDHDLSDDVASSSSSAKGGQQLEETSGSSSTSSRPSLPTSINLQLIETPLPSSTFSDKLHTNYIPSFPEIAEIKQYVSAVDDRVAGYDAQIATLEATLRDIQSKRRQLLEINTAHRALASPFRRLPPEILQVIFVWCLPQTRNAVMHASEAPVLLGRVCSEWRRISMSTPELWASLHIVPPNVNFTNPASSTSRFERKRDLIEMWLARSGACPLSVSMVWFAGDSDDEVRLCGSLLEILVPMCGRWKVLDFQLPLKMFKPFVGLKVWDVPLLEGLSLMDNRTPSDTDAVDRWPESLNFAESASRLRTFTLTFFSGGIKLPSIPWSQLTTLYLESNIAFFFSDSREMIGTLGLCSNLISCTLKFPLSHTASLPLYEKLEITAVLPELEVLCLDGDQHLLNTFHMNNTLSNICTPKLRRLEILGRAGRPDGTSNVPEPLTALKTLFSKSKCPLEKLNLESMTMVPEEFIECLRLVPTLDELVVHNWTARVFTPSFAIHVAGAGAGAQEEHADDADAVDVAENRILLALTISSSKDPDEVPLKKPTPSGSTMVDEETKVQVDDVQQGDQEGRSKMEKGPIPDDNFDPTSNQISPSLPPEDIDATPLCPNLQKFDFTLCDASQRLLCNFVSSRWEHLPEGVKRLKSIKSNFTAFEEDEVKTKMQRYKAEGLDVFVTYQVPISDDVNPSPWTGLEGPP